MPPFLPRIIEHVEIRSRKKILTQLRSLVAKYEQFYADHELDHHDAEEILEEITNVGEDIAKYLQPLRGCLTALSKSDLDIKNLIIHSDEHNIPWHLARLYFPEFDFLCNRYACGTILVDEADEAALHGYMKYNSRRSKQPDMRELPEKRFFLIAGELGRAVDGQKDLAFAYVERLRDLLQKSGICPMKIQCISAMDWIKSGRKPADELKAIFRDAHIVHFTGHFIDGKMKLAKDVLVGPADLDLPDLTSKPLIVLHGCSSAGSAGSTGGEDTQIYRTFLNRGAGGCLATVLPVNIPTAFSEGAETLIEIFYNNVFRFPWKSYGWALREARREFRYRLRRPNDPQVLFYQLFGDPRETLVQGRTPTVAEQITKLDDTDWSPKKTAATLHISGEGFDEQELRQMVLDMDGVLDARYQRPAAVMGEATLLNELPHLVLTVVILSPVVIGDILIRLRKKFQHIRVDSSSDQQHVQDRPN